MYNIIFLLMFQKLGEELILALKIASKIIKMLKTIMEFIPWVRVQGLITLLLKFVLMCIPLSYDRIFKKLRLQTL